MTIARGKYTDINFSFLVSLGELITPRGRVTRVHKNVKPRIRTVWAAEPESNHLIKCQ